MANNENLIKSCDLTPQERRENASKAGKASVEARRRRKTLREELLALLSDGDIQNRISLALIDEAMNGNKAGSVTKAFEVIRDTVGEKPTEKIMVADVDPSVISEVERMVGEDDEGSGG
jgi:hypothetical protein